METSNEFNEIKNTSSEPISVSEPAQQSTTSGGRVYDNGVKAALFGAMLGLILGGGVLILAALSNTGTFSTGSGSYSQSSRSSSSSYSSQSNSNRYSPNPGNRYSWLRGRWQCNSSRFGTMYLVIDGVGGIVSIDDYGVEEGTYYVNEDTNELCVQFDNHPKDLITTYKLKNKQIYFGNGAWYIKYAEY